MENALRSAVTQDTDSLCRPFADPVGDAARMFRAILTATANPGRIVSAFGPTEFPPSLGTTGFGAALTLLDADTPVYLSPRTADASASANLRFHCGCPIVQDPGEAAFAIMRLTEAEALLPRLSVGTPDYPDTSATALILVDGFTDDDTVRLTGPGIFKYKTMGMNAPREVWSLLRANADRYPLGFDTIFVGDGEVVGLPRSTKIEPTIIVEEC